MSTTTTAALRTFHIWNRVTGDHLGIQDAYSAEQALAEAANESFLRAYCDTMKRLHGGYFPVGGRCRPGGAMITDRRDPAFDDRAYCPDCLRLFDEDDIEAMGDDPIEVTCPYCHHLISHALTHEQALEEEASRRAGYVDDWG